MRRSDGNRRIAAPTAESYLIRPSSRAASGAKFTAIDLFAGAGGISLGLSNAGFRVLLASDISEVCAATHRRNMPDIPFLTADIAELSPSEIRSITGLKLGELDLLVGGPPCQGFSILGARKGDDPRNRLIQEFFRIAAGLRPKVLVIENVPGCPSSEFLGQRAASFKGGSGSSGW
jgi:DNA (cytosine-5)-methyltransferase 1